MSSDVDQYVVPEAVELTREEGIALFDEEARRVLGISGEEFLAAYDAGKLDDFDPIDVQSVVMMIPFARVVWK